MEDLKYIAGIVLLSAFFIIHFGQKLYFRFFAPYKEVKAKVMGKDYKAGVKSASNGKYISNCNYYWADFHVAGTKESLELGMDLTLYTEINEGQSGILTYRKGYALSFVPLKRKRQGRTG